MPDRLNESRFYKNIKPVPFRKTARVGRGTPLRSDSDPQQNNPPQIARKFQILHCLYGANLIMPENGLIHRCGPSMRVTSQIGEPHDP